MSNPLPSRTSIWAAAARAVGAERNPDYLAAKLIGAEERALLGEHALARALESGDNMQHPEVQGAMRTLIVRTRFVDEALERAIAAGAAQVVIMGAGWDTRAHRFAGLLRGARVFEVDQPATQNWKRRRVADTIGADPANLAYLQIDFRRQTLGDVLAAGGYDARQKTFFIWEGVTMYLPEEAVRDTLRWIAMQAPGSSVVFDFAHRNLIDSLASSAKWNPPNEAARVAMDRLRQIKSWGEPWIFGIPSGAADEFLRELGLEHRETLGMASEEAARRYLGWDGTSPLSAAIRQFYSITEAAVS